MNFQEFTKVYRKQVDTLSYERQLDFAVGVCKKLFFDYQRFYQRNDFGSPDVLLDAISKVEQRQVVRIDPKELKTILQRINEITPDSEDFGNANYAINAAGTFYETVEFLLDRDINHIYNIGTYLIDTVDSKVQGDGDLSDGEIDQHPLMLEAKSYLLQETK
jgi:uncharacterized protein YjaG (DUF416 family)